MVDEVFQIGFETTGDAEAAKAFERLKIEQLAMSKQAKTLQEQLKKLEKAGSENTSEFRELQRALIQAKEASSQLGREANGIAASVRRQAQATEQSTIAIRENEVATSSLNDATTVGGQRMGEYAGALGNIGSVFGTVNPAMGQAGSLVGAIGTATSAASSAMGGFGLVIGGVTAVVGIMLPLLQSTQEELEDVAEEADAAAQSVSDLADALDRQDRPHRLASGVGVSSEEVEQEIENTERAIQRLEQLRVTRVQAFAEERGATLESARQILDATQRAGAMGSIEFGEDAVRVNELLADEERRIAQERERIEDLTQGLAVARAREATEAERTADADERAAAAARLAGQAEEREGARRDRSQAGAGIAAALSAADKAMSADIAAKRAEFESLFDRMFGPEAMEGAVERANRLADARERDALAMIDAGRQIQSDLEQVEEVERQLEENRKKRHDERIRRIEQERDAQRRQADASAQAWKQFKGQVVNDALAPVTDLAGEMLNFLAEGSENTGDAFLRMLDKFLQATAIEYTIKSLAEAANAAAAAARQDWAGAAMHGIASAMAGGVALATGLGSVALTPTPASPGSDSSGTQPNPGAAGAVSQNITINLFSPNAVSTKAEQAQNLAAIERVGRRELGRV